MMQQEAERLRRQMHEVASEFDRLLGQAADRSAEGAAKASQRIGRCAEDVRIGLLDLQDEAAVQGRRAGRHLKRSLGRHPWSMAGAAVAIAAAIALIAARRRRG